MRAINATYSCEIEAYWFTKLLIQFREQLKKKVIFNLSCCIVTIPKNTYFI